MFWDLALPEGEGDVHLRRAKLAAAVQLGWDAVATVHQATERLTEQDQCNLQPVDLAALISAAEGVAPALRFYQNLVTSPGSGGRPRQPTQLTRLTLVADQPSHAQVLTANNPVAASYDIVAIQPLSERVLQQACSSLAVDIITLDLARRLPFRLRPAMLSTALASGIHFEICYAPALRDPTARRHLFSNTQALAMATRGQGIVISSGARTAFELRGPADVANMATLFGLSASQGKAAVSERCQSVVEHGKLRKAYKGVISIEHVPSSGASASGKEHQAAPMDVDPPSSKAKRRK